MTLPTWFYPGLFALSALTSLSLLKFIKSRHILDIPNDRSSHNLPTPKGGGIGFAIILSIGIIIAAAYGSAINTALLGLGIAALALSVTGLVDDIHQLPSSLRFIVQFIAGLVFVSLLPETGVSLGFSEIPHGVFVCFALLFLLWMTNLYNFMDGIDGIAATQAILVGVAIYGLDMMGFYSGELASLSLGLAFCLGGFLLFNFPPAKIFMGDAGSVFLGFALGAMALLETSTSADNLWIWLILLAVFICDATATLLARLIQGRKFYQAHRSHIYQLYTKWAESALATQGMATEQARCRAHRRYLLLFSLFFALILFPLSFVVARGWLSGFVATATTYTALIMVFLFLGAGKDTLFAYGFMRKK